MDELLLARIDEKHIHIIAKDESLLDKAHLPEATLMEKSDFIPAIERGVAVGGATGLLAGLVAVTFPPAGLVLGGGALLGITLAGAGFGAWVSGMIGVSVHNSRLQEFEQAVESGEMLMIIDVPKARVDEMTRLVTSLHPEAEVEGTEPRIPAFP